MTARMDSIRIGYVSIFGHDCDVEYVPMESGFVVNIPYGDSSEDEQYQIARNTVRQWIRDGRLCIINDEAYRSILTMDDILTDIYGSDRGKEESEIYSAVQKSETKKSETKDLLTSDTTDRLDDFAVFNTMDLAF